MWMSLVNNRFQMKDESDIELGESLKVCRSRGEGNMLAGNFEINIAKNIHHLGFRLQMKMRSKYESSSHLSNIMFKYCKS